MSDLSASPELSNSKQSSTAETSIGSLLRIMAQLRDPESGCPWDIEQNFATIAPYTIEEAYEVADAIDRNDMGGLKDELGDLLLQVVFHARMAEEHSLFDFSDVVQSISDKMVRRHPHVFSDALISDAATQTIAWEDQKALERARNDSDRPSRTLDNIPLNLPALLRSSKIGKRLARVGFDWSENDAVLAKIDEEMGELRAEMGPEPDKRRLEEELGDVLFSVAQLGRKLGIDPEAALKLTNRKVEKRFRFVEDMLSEQGEQPQDKDIAELERLWLDAKNRKA